MYSPFRSDVDKEDRKEWELSSSSEEDFSNAQGADEHGEWQFEIIGEAVNYAGDVRYEVEWPGWTRKDKTNTTFEKASFNKLAVRRWNSEQKNRRKNLANDLEIELWTTTDIHNEGTRHRAQALEEKTRREAAHPCNWADQMAKLLVDKEGMMHEDTKASSALFSPARPRLRDTAARRQQQSSHTSFSCVSINRGDSTSGRSSTVQSSRSSDIRPTPSSSFTSVSPVDPKPPSLPPVSMTKPQIRRRSPVRPPSPSPSLSVSSLSEIRVWRPASRHPSSGSSSIYMGPTSVSASSSVPRSNKSKSIKNPPPIRSPSPAISVISISSSPEPRVIRPLPSRASTFSSRTSNTVQSMASSSKVTPAEPVSAMSRGTPARFIRPSPSNAVSSMLPSTKAASTVPISEKARGRPRKMSSAIERFVRSSSNALSSMSSITKTTSAASISEKAKGKLPEKLPATGRLMRSLPSRSLPPKSQSPRMLLQNKWNRATHVAKAATISFINDVDDEELPVLVFDFKYLETGYHDPKGYAKAEEFFYLKCDCSGCFNPAYCDCQGSSQIVDEKDELAFAYTPDGLFAFNLEKGVEVVECNKYCECNLSCCPNRVAQRPRDVPIEIFKTCNRGWGVRPVVDVKKGKVLGIYTGELLLHEDAEDLPDNEKDYLFALDASGHADDDGSLNNYTVDSRKYGNWSRFINHSCSPNLVVYPVVYDTLPDVRPHAFLLTGAKTNTKVLPPQTNLPYLAFVATESIPARTEFTFDYNPATGPAAKISVKGKSKRVINVPDGSEICHCGARGCRGYMASKT